MATGIIGIRIKRVGIMAIGIRRIGIMGIGIRRIGTTKMWHNKYKYP